MLWFCGGFVILLVCCVGGVFIGVGFGFLWFCLGGILLFDRLGRLCVVGILWVRVGRCTGKKGGRWGSVVDDG